MEVSICMSMKLDGFGDIVISGYSINSNGNHIAILKYNPAGTLLWLNRYTDYTTGQTSRMSFGYAGDIYITGGVFNHSPSYDAVLLKYDKNGLLQWSEIYDSPYSDYDWGKDVFSYVDRNTGTVNIFTTINSWGNSIDADIVTIRYTEAIPSGALQNSSITDNILPLKYELGQNYPNPFNPATKISYSIAEPGNVEITLYDILGKEIKTLVDSYHNAGAYEFLLNSEGLSSGTYFYKMQSGNFINVKKFMLVK
jgi:hypothetical protein